MPSDRVELQLRLILAWGCWQFLELRGPFEQFLPRFEFFFSRVSKYWVLQTANSSFDASRCWVIVHWWWGFLGSFPHYKNFQHLWTWNLTLGRHGSVVIGRVCLYNFLETLGFYRTYLNCKPWPMSSWELV